MRSWQEAPLGCANPVQTCREAPLPGRTHAGQRNMRAARCHAPLSWEATPQGVHNSETFRVGCARFRPGRLCSLAVLVDFSRKRSDTSPTIRGGFPPVSPESRGSCKNDPLVRWAELATKKGCAPQQVHLVPNICNMINVHAVLSPSRCGL